MSIESLRSRIRRLPQRPGVYLMHDADGNVVYAGKAKNLRKRVISYARHSGFASPRLRKLVEMVEDISVIRTENETEALIVESRLIRRYQPFFNVELKMGERYPYVRITDEPYPRIQITRRRETGNGQYIGPFVRVAEVRQVLRLIERYFPLRTCRTASAQDGWNERPCIRYELGRCPGPCAGMCGKREYRERVADVALLLKGHAAELVNRLRARMDRAAGELDFEEAARYRDTIRAVWKLSRQKISSTLSDDMDENTWDALVGIEKDLGLDNLPWRIDGFDISHSSGHEMYGVCVVFDQGSPNRSLYRRYRIRNVEGVDDFRAIQETLERRYRIGAAEELSPPQLILIDGGPIQLEFAQRALAGTAMEKSDIVALAKREELVYLSGKRDPVRLDRDHPGLRILQRVRNEAHRFAIESNRSAGNARFSVSMLEQVPGIGKIRAAKLVTHFGSVRRIAESTAEEISKEPGITLETALKILQTLKGREEKPFNETRAD
ncbi:MAG: excinuclease ABC subunit UvrC [Synergistota bacterium]|nr:excinuclease ABC subunit UvrC [Synergistota bacterium]